MSLIRQTASKVYNLIVGIFPGLSRPSWRTQYLGNQEILLMRPEHQLVLPGWDLSLSPWIIKSGTWEPVLTEALSSYCKEGVVALDIGANLGWFASVMASAGADVHAFEPNPRLEPFLRKNVFLNAGARTPRCSVNRCAVGAEEGSVSIKFPHWLVGGAGIHESDQKQFLDSLIPESVETPMVTVDAFVRAKQLNAVSVIKIDVEGFEESVIQGALDTIRNARSMLVALEYTRGRYSDGFPALIFGLFARVSVLPERNEITLKELEAYEREEYLADRPLLELLCIK
jgi:FkbM family methyltransferase